MSTFRSICKYSIRFSHGTCRRGLTACPRHCSQPHAIPYCRGNELAGSGHNGRIPCAACNVFRVTDAVQARAVSSDNLTKVPAHRRSMRGFARTGCLYGKPREQVGRPTASRDSYQCRRSCSSVGLRRGRCFGACTTSGLISIYMSPQVTHAITRGVASKMCTGRRL